MCVGNLLQRQQHKRPLWAAATMNSTMPRSRPRQDAKHPDEFARG